MIYISKSVDDKLDEYADFLRYSASYTINEAKNRRWEIEYQINQHCNPILMKPSTSGTIKFKSVLQRQEIKRLVNNRYQLMRIIKRRKGNRGNTQWNVDYIVSNNGDVFITAIKCYNTFSESVNYKDIDQIINECVNRCLRMYLNENVNSNVYKYLENIEYLYHATPACYVKSIIQYGLGGRIPKTRFWDYENTPYENISQGCFLATDEYVAESYVENSESFEKLADIYLDRYGKELEIIVFGIKVSDLNLNLLSIDENQLFDEDTSPTFFYKGVIPYNILKKIKMYV